MGKEQAVRPAAGWRRNWPWWRPALPYSILLLGFWFALSGRFDLEHLVVGIVVVVLSQAITTRLFPSRLQRLAIAPAGSVTAGSKLRLWGSISSFVVSFVASMLAELVVANLRVAMIVLNPRLPIAPTLFDYSPPLRTEWGRVLLANAVTLTPGTLTVELGPGERFLVHALTPQAARSLPGWSAERRLVRLEQDIQMEEALR